MSKKEPPAAELKHRLTAEQYRVTQECGTEPPFTGRYYAHKEGGKYLCVVCGNRLFASGAKYDSGSGWPSFWEPIAGEAVAGLTQRGCATASTPPRSILRKIQATLSRRRTAS